MDLNWTTRIEIIDNSKWRVYTNYNCQDVKLEIQDNWRTLKIFLKSNKEGRISLLNNFINNLKYNESRI